MLWGLAITQTVLTHSQVCHMLASGCPFQTRPMRNAKIYFINAAVLSGGMVTYQEVFTYSFETLVGNIGGTCGIWIGVSIMTLLQLFMFFLEESLRKGAKARLRLYQAYKAEQRDVTDDLV